MHTVELLLERDAPAPIIVVCALCAPEGIERLRDAGLCSTSSPRRSTTTSTTHAFIVPGLGDAGDRQFGPPA